MASNTIEWATSSDGCLVVLDLLHALIELGALGLIGNHARL